MLENARKDFYFCLFLGFLGVHKFRKGKKDFGFLYLFTLGILGLGWIIDTIIYLIRLIHIKKSINNYAFINIEETDLLSDGYAFEEYIAELFHELEYDSIEITNSARDFGADIIATKGEIRYAIQCKYYSTPVGLSAVQEVFAAKFYYNCHVAIVLTNNFFTAPAMELAEAVNVLLWDRLKLSSLINEVNVTQ